MQTATAASVRLRDELMVVALFCMANLLIHILPSGIWGFHRDELLYLQLGRHLDWGYWSNPPLIGFLAWLLTPIPQPDVWLVRLIPALFSSGVVAIAALIARELGGGRSALVMTCLAMLLSPAFLRIGVLFQPVVIDVFFWALCFLFIVRFINDDRALWLWAIGAGIGLGMLNKYSIAFLVLGVLLALPFTPQRRLFGDRRFYGAAGIALLIILPNLIWQAAHGFPVIHHMQDLQTTQLAFVRPQDFIFEQIIHHLPVFLLWMAGFIMLIRGRYRLVAWIFVAVMILLLLLGGKSYYTLGLYPPLFAAGAVWLEERAHRLVQAAFFGAATFLLVAASPLALPYLPVASMVTYSSGFVERTGIDAPMRWEGGEAHALPQDYADMLGWEELAAIVEDAYHSAADPAHVMIYCENYGQAGAVAHFSGGRIPEPVSFSDSYRLWAPREIDPEITTLIYVNDELGEDVEALFDEVRIHGTVTSRYARERGTRVYVATRPRAPFHEFWRERVSMLDSRDAAG